MDYITKKVNFYKIAIKYHCVAQAFIKENKTREKEGVTNSNIGIIGIIVMLVLSTINSCNHHFFMQ